MIPKVKEWKVRVAGVHGHFIVLAPTRALAVLNLRSAGYYGALVSCGAVRKPRGFAGLVTYVHQGRAITAQW